MKKKKVKKKNPDFNIKQFSQGPLLQQTCIFIYQDLENILALGTYRWFLRKYTSKAGVVPFVCV